MDSIDQQFFLRGEGALDETEGGDHEVEETEINEKPSDPKSEKQLDDFEQAVDQVYGELQQLVKQLREIKNKIPRLKGVYRRMKNKSQRSTQPKKLTGFYARSPVPEKLATMLDLEDGVEMNRVELVSQVTKMLRRRKLYYEKNRQVFRADQPLIELLELPENVNQQTDPRHPGALSIYSIHTYIAKLLKKN